MQSIFFYVSIVSFIVGIFFASLMDFGPYFLIFFIILAFLSLFFYKKENARLDFFLISFLIFLFFSFGFARMSYDNFLAQSKYIFDDKLGEEISLRGIIIDEPDKRENLSNIKFEFYNNGKKYYILLRTDPYAEYNYGDELRVTGRIEKPRAFETDGRVFRYDKYLAKDEIYYLMPYPKIEKLSINNGFPLKALLLSLKEKYLENINMLIPEPAAALAGGITVGSKDSLGKDLKKDFRITGVIHIVVLSGYNIALISSFMENVFAVFPVFLSRLFASIGIVSFAVLTGASSTVLRASAMGLIAILAKSTARTYLAIRALFIVAFLMLLWNPKILLADISFQLSFLATFSLIIGMPIIQDYLERFSLPIFISDLLSATISTYVGVLPLILYYMGDLSLVSLPVNLLVLPVIAPAMLLSFLASVLAFLSDAFASSFAWTAYFLLGYILKIVDYFASLDFAFLHIKPFSFLFVILAYIIMGIFVHKKMYNINA